MLTLVLVVGLCSDVGCIYDNVTSKFDIANDAECVQIANYGNSRNIDNNERPRFSCMPLEKYRYLAGREI
jgi:hypothetical protein